MLERASEIFSNGKSKQPSSDVKQLHAHKKTIIIDGETVITDSFNFSKAVEEKIAENLLIIKSKELAKKYIENWNGHKQQSEIYPPKY